MKVSTWGRRSERGGGISYYSPAIEPHLAYGLKPSWDGTIDKIKLTGSVVNYAA